MLSEQQVEHYWREGYVLVPQLLEQTQLAALNKRFLAFANGDLSLAPMMKLMRDVMVVKGEVEAATPVHAVNKLMNFEDDEALYQFVLHPGLRSCVQQLLGEQLYSLSTNVFNKPPGVDGRHPFHQDLRYFRIRPADKILGVWTAILPATRNSGCLAVLPGSHKGPLLEHGDPDWEFVNAGFYAASGVDARERVHVEMAPGDTLLFHPLLIHGSGQNRSTNFRRAISTHYAAGDAQSEHRDWHQGKQARPIPS